MILPNGVGQTMRGQGCLPKRFGPQRNLQDSFTDCGRHGFEAPGGQEPLFRACARSWIDGQP
jgi:hypothetical protein